MDRRGPRLLLALAGAGAVLALLDPAEPIGALVGLGAMLVGALAQLRGRRGRQGPVSSEPDWRTLLFAGTALAAIGIPLALAVETAGGLLTVIGCGAVVAAVALGFPAAGSGPGARIRGRMY